MPHFLISMCALLSYFVAFGALAQNAAPPHVVVSVKPLHSLVASVMEGSAEPEILVSGDSSPHGFSLKPSQAQLLSKADVVFYLDDHFEMFLARAFETLPKTVIRSAMVDAPGLKLLPARPDALFTKIIANNSHAHTDDHHEHADGHHHAESSHDPHFWLDINNAIAMATYIESVLSKKYPTQKELYQSNRIKLVNKLKALNQKLTKDLALATGAPLVVFHDAYQYYEKAYGLNVIAAMTISPEHMISARHLLELKKHIKSESVRCVFYEPGFSQKTANTIIEGTGARTAEIDPEGLSLPPGKDMYPALLLRMSESIKDCLDQ